MNIHTGRIINANKEKQMTSKLIERLINKEYLTERERREWLNTIKQDLERLEVLELDNKTLHQDIVMAFASRDEALEMWAERKQRLEMLEYALKLKQDTIDGLNVANELLSNRANVLMQENKKLKQQVEDLENNQETVLTTLEISVQQNEKLKKAIKYEIELLIERRFNAYACDNYEIYNIIDAIIEELKEVLNE